MAIRNLVSKISTPDLFLRKLDIEDAVDLQQLLARNKEYMVPWIPWAAGEPEPIMVKKEKIRIWNGEFNLDQKYTYGIFSNENDYLLIGYAYDLDNARQDLFLVILDLEGEIVSKQFFGSEYPDYITSSLKIGNKVLMGASIRGKTSFANDFSIIISNRTQ